MLRRVLSVLSYDQLLKFEIFLPIVLYCVSLFDFCQRCVFISYVTHLANDCNLM